MNFADRKFHYLSWSPLWPETKSRAAIAVGAGIQLYDTLGEPFTREIRPFKDNVYALDEDVPLIRVLAGVIDDP